MKNVPNNILRSKQDQEFYENEIIQREVKSAQSTLERYAKERDIQDAKLRNTLLVFSACASIVIITIIALIASQF